MQQHPSNDSLPIGNFLDGQKATINGVDIYYTLNGTGHPVLLLHGGIGSTEDWGELIPSLISAGFQTVAMDCRGRGRSSWGDVEITYEQMASDAMGLLDHLGIQRAHLVGWSDGAVIGFEIAIHHPERLAKVVAYGVNFSPEGVHDPVISPKLESHFARLAEDFRRLSPTPDRLDEMFAILDDLYSAAPNFDSDQLKGIDTPFLLLFGNEEEFINSDHVRQLGTLMSRAKTVHMQGTGHFAVFEKPHEFSEIVLNFLME